MAQGRFQPIHRYVAAVAIGGAGVLAWTIVADARSFGRIEARYWLFTAFLFLGELVTVRVPRREETVEITTSPTFSFALLLEFGMGPAIAALAGATLLADLIRRKEWVKTLFNVSQYIVALAAGGAVVALFTSVPHVPLPAFGPWDLPAILGGAFVFFIVNLGLTRTAVDLAQGGRWRPSIAADFPFQAATTLLMLLLSPVVVIAAERGLAFAALLVLPMVGAYRAGGLWLEKQYKERLAMQDPLTGLPNRRLFYERVERAIAGHRPDDPPIAVMIIDLDHFKEVNDSLGHHVGDLLLGMIGPRLQQALRETDVIARLGGDEFAVLLPGVSTGTRAMRVAEKILSALEEPFETDGLALDIGASIGLVLYPEHARDVTTLIQRADIAMYMAKEAHTGYELYRPERDRNDPRRLSLIGELRRGIAAGQLVLHYQPKAEMRTGRTTAVEALARWEHPERGLMMPDEFIPLAEHTGLIRPLTIEVLSQALRQCRAWREAGFEVSVAVNLSARNLQDPDFPLVVARLLRDNRVEPGWLELEITEGALVLDPVRALGVLSRLSMMDVPLSLDDYGTGYSSLAYLKRLPIRELKIDKSFVINMAVDPSDEVIVRSTVELARNLGLTVVAEGVETRKAWERLASYGCDLAQGYYLSRPLPPEALERWLAERAASAGPGPEQAAAS